MKLFLFGDIYDSQPRVKRFPVFIMEMNATCLWGFFSARSFAERPRINAVLFVSKRRVRTHGHGHFDTFHVDGAN